MTLLIRTSIIDNRITKRITPFKDVIAVFASYQSALKEIHKIKRRFDKKHIHSAIDNDVLLIREIPYNQFMSVSYNLESATLYGDKIDSTVYNLRRFNGYIKDQDKPYRYDNLGWFTNPKWGKLTKEWQILRYIINTNDMVDGIESELEIKIFGPYDCTDMNPSLCLVPYKLQ